MANRTVTYTIKLISDIARQARTDATAIEGANQRQSRSYQSMANSINRTDAVARKLRATALQTNTALQNMGNGVGARMARQFDATIAKLKEIKQLGGDIGGKLLKGGAMTVAGGVAGIKTADMVTQKPIAYEARIARIAQTGYDGRNLGEFKNTQELVDKTIRRSIDGTQGGGGTRDQAAEALGNLVGATGDLNKSLSMLPTIMHVATASGANATDLTDIVIKGTGTGFIKDTPEAVGDALEKAVAAGKAGQFELPDMAKWLAQQFGEAKTAGMGGERGFERLLMMNQVAMLGAGSKDEAGNNVSNLLSKLNSADTAKDFKKSGYGDLDKYLVDANRKGADAVDAWIALLKTEMGKNKDYQAAQKKLTDAKTPEEQRAANQAIMDIALGTSVGKFFQDRQAKGALIPLLNDVTGVGQNVTKAINERQGLVDFLHQSIATTTAFKQEQAGNLSDGAVTDSFTQLKPAIDGVIEGFNNLAHAFPTGAAATAGIAGVGSVVGSTIMGASGLAYLYDWVGKRKGKGSAPLPGTGSIHTPTTESTTATAPTAKPRTPKTHASASVSDDVARSLNKSAALAENAKYSRIAGRLAGVAQVGLMAYDGYKILSSDASAGHKAQGLASVAGSGLGGWGGAAAGAEAGALAGAALGSIVPGLGTAIGAALGTVVGGLGGGLAGSWAGGELGDVLGSSLQKLIDPPEITAAVHAGVASGMQQAPQYLTNPTLNQMPINMPPQEVSVKMQDGTLKVQVQVSPTSELINATARVDQPLFPLQLADGGATNPGNYGGGYRGPR